MTELRQGLEASAYASVGLLSPWAGGPGDLGWAWRPQLSLLGADVCHRQVVESPCLEMLQTGRGPVRPALADPALSRAGTDKMDEMRPLPASMTLCFQGTNASDDLEISRCRPGFIRLDLLPALMSFLPKSDLILAVTVVFLGLHATGKTTADCSQHLQAQRWQQPSQTPSHVVRCDATSEERP